MPTENNTVPKHVAIIMDGNGRWGAAKFGERTKGHVLGANRAKEIAHFAKESGIKILTLYAFSSENWKRPKYEVNVIINLFKQFMITDIDELSRLDVRVKFIGDRKGLPKSLQVIINSAEGITTNNRSFLLQIAFSYGGRQEIVSATQRIAELVKDGKIEPSEITEKIFSQYLYTSGVPDPDLVIRVGGEERVSNFLLWQTAYSEFIFKDVLWPDFTTELFTEYLEEYSTRDRRRGQVSVRLIEASQIQNG